MFTKIKLFFRKNYLIAIIILVALLLRGYRYPQFPIAGETADEIAWTMLGSSLLQEGQPTSWSYFGSYQNFIYQDNGPGKAPWVRPVVDHPPLFSFIPGFFHGLKNSWDQDPSVKLIRLPMVFLGVVNVWLLYLVAQKTFTQKRVAYLATTIYAVVPTFVFGSRLVVAENLLVSWGLLSIYLLKSKLRRRHLYLIIVSILAILTKVSGLVIPLGIIGYGWQKSNKKLTLAGLVGLVIGEASYLAYGLWLNWQLFVEVNLSQSNRNLGLSTLFNRFFLHPAVVEKIFFDGWLILGLLALFSWFVLKPKSQLIIKIYSILWLLFIATTAGETTFHGWYDYPLYPLLALAIAWLIDYLATQKMYWLVWLSWLLVLPTFRLALIFTNQYTELSNLTIRAIMALGAIPLGFYLIKKDYLAKKSIICLGLLLVTASVIAVLFINDRVYWEMVQFYVLG